MILKRKEIVDILSDKTLFYKSTTKEFMEALEEFIVEYLNKATLKEDVEIQLAKGLVIGAKMNPEKQAKDPRNQNDVIVPERILPYVRFTNTFKQKINE